MTSTGDLMTTAPNSHINNKSDPLGIWENISQGLELKTSLTEGSNGFQLSPLTVKLTKNQVAISSQLSFSLHLSVHNMAEAQIA